MQAAREPSIAELVGRELDQIVFVRDYVQFGFDGYWLTLYHWPAISAGGKIQTFPSIGYCDALHAQINDVVSYANLETGKAVTVRFTNGTVLSSSLEDDAYTGPEAGNFSTRNPGDALVVF